MLLLTMFAWLTANVHSAVAHCLCAESCHEAHSEALASGAATLPSVSQGSLETGAGVFIHSEFAQNCDHHEPAFGGAAAHDGQGRGCCDSPDSNICLDHTQELVTAPVSYGSSSVLVSLSLSQFVHLHVSLFQALICAVAEDPAHTRASARVPAAEDTRTSGWSHLVHTALPVRGPSVLA